MEGLPAGLKQRSSLLAAHSVKEQPAGLYFQTGLSRAGAQFDFGPRARAFSRSAASAARPSRASASASRVCASALPGAARLHFSIAFPRQTACLPPAGPARCGVRTGLFALRPRPGSVARLACAPPPRPHPSVRPAPVRQESASRHYGQPRPLLSRSSSPAIAGRSCGGFPRRNSRPGAPSFYRKRTAFAGAGRRTPPRKCGAAAQRRSSRAPLLSGGCPPTASPRAPARSPLSRPRRKR